MPGVAVYSGPTLEDALAAARAAHGPRVKIVRALRVRRGVRGLLGHSRYDVHARVPKTIATALAGQGESAAVPASSSHRRPPAPPVSPTRPAEGPIDVLAALVDAANERERAVLPEPTWAWSGEAEVGALLEDVAALGSTVRGDDVGHPSLNVAQHEIRPQRSAAAGLAATTGGQDAEASAWRDLLASALQPAPVEPSRPLVEGLVSPAEPEPRRWSRNDLRGIGVPAAVLRRLPVEDPRDDAGWRFALREAIAAVVPEPREADDDHPVVVSGHGLAGVVAILRASVEDGAAPGTISFQGRRRQASAGAMVEVLAACARS